MELEDLLAVREVVVGAKVNGNRLRARSRRFRCWVSTDSRGGGEAKNYCLLETVEVTPPET